jgi:hypothetical protein
MGKSNILQNINAERVIRISLICSLLIIYIFLWAKMISTPSDRTGTDFIHFYAAGQIAKQYGFSSVYDLDLQRKMEQVVVGFTLAKDQVLPYNHMPYLIPFLKLLIGPDYISSFTRWVIIMLGTYIAGSIFFLDTILPARNNEIHGTLLAGIFLFFPFFVSLLLGQDTALLFLGTSLWCAGILKKKAWLTAAGLSLTTIRPHICLTLAIPLLFAYRKAWWRFFTLAGLLMLISILILGKDGTLGFINMLVMSANGTSYGMHASDMLNLTGLMLRTLPFVDPDLIHIIRWIGYLVGICLVCVLWFRAHEFDGRLLGVSLVIALLCAPHLHYHDLTLLVIPLVFAAMLPSRLISPERLAFAPLFASPLLMLGPIHFIFPYVLYALLGWWLTRKPVHVV